MNTMTKVQVWYQLDDNAPSKVKVNDDADVDDLKDAIKTKWGDRLPCAAPELKVFAAGGAVDRTAVGPLEPYDPIPTGTTGRNPLIVVAKPQKNLINHAPNKKQRRGIEIDRNDLLRPEKMVPPNMSTPDFVCPENWLEDVRAEVVCGLQHCDHMAVQTDRDDDTLHRVPPMGLVRCSRGGKTRALCEIANKMKGFQIGGPDDKCGVACIYVSFNDTTGLEQWEQGNPLQALLRRIAFAASAPTGYYDPAAFSEFLQDKPVWEISSFLDWIQQTPCILFIDEMNNLDKLTETNSTEAEDFGLFLKQKFIGMENRYLVFSSHLLGTFNFFSQYLDRSRGSSRHVTLQELPIVSSLQEAMSLKNSLDSVREAMYYGLVPGMIYESRLSGKCIAGKREYWVTKAINNHLRELDGCFRSILMSLIDGFTNQKFPEELGILLDSVQDKVGDLDKIRWVPYHLQFVLHELSSANFAHARLADQLSDYCNLLKDAKQLSGEGWEGLFVLFLVARCLNCKDDNTFVPDLWFETGQEEVEIVLNCYDASSNEMRPFSDCKTWDEMKAGVVQPTNKTRYCLNILYPTHNNFEVYDVIVVFFLQGTRKHVVGYQLKEGKAQRKHKAHPDMNISLFVQGDPPAETQVDDEKGWTIPGKDAIDTFFGESGKHWTPESWRKFTNSTVPAA